jgi:phage terminase small subunit
MRHCSEFGHILPIPYLAGTMADEKHAGDDSAIFSEKMERFCQEYLVDLNGTAAARRAGYSVDSASEIAYENLRKPQITARIQELRVSMGSTFNVTKERIAQELALIAFGDTKVVFDENGKLKSPETWTEEGRLIASYEESETVFGDEDNGGVKKTKKVRQWDKNKALEQLSRLMGYNEPDKMLLSGLRINVTDKDESS